MWLLASCSSTVIWRWRCSTGPGSSAWGNSMWHRDAGIMIGRMLARSTNLMARYIVYSIMIMPPRLHLPAFFYDELLVTQLLFSPMFVTGLNLPLFSLLSIFFFFASNRGVAVFN